MSVDRRTLLKLLAATAMSGCGPGRPEDKGVRIVVAGAGIVGASIAYHLSLAGASVTVIDQQAPASHASRGTFAWINATWAKQPRSYHSFTQDSVTYWHELQQALDLPVRWSGSLEWFTNDERQDKLAGQIAQQLEWGEPARMIDSNEFAELEPKVLLSPTSTAAYSPNDGTVDPILATQKLLAAAQTLGATLLYPSELTDVTLANGRLIAVETSNGTIAADRLVLATGAAENVLAKMADVEIPQRTKPGVIVITKPMPRLLQRIISAPGIHMHQRDDGRIVLGEQDGAPQNEAHALRLDGRPNSFPSPVIAQEHASRMLAVAADFAPDIQAAQVEDVYIGWRPLPIDGHPVIGASPSRPDVYIAVMHSGVTLSPIVGKLAAQELLTDTLNESLAPYRPDRSFEMIKRY
jgi:glycine/D-amino acid oxidase-like deaminating enzyme